MNKINVKWVFPVVTSCLFAGSFVAAKYLTLDLGPLTTSLLRYVVALAFLTILAFTRSGKTLKIEKEDIFIHVLLGLFGIVGYHFFFFTALKYTAVANTAVINAFSPIVTGLMAEVFLKERLSFKNYIGIIIAAAGVLIIISKGKIGNLLSMNFNIGDLLMMCSVLSWVVYSLIIKKLLKKYDGFVITYYATLFGVVLLVLLAMTEDFLNQIMSVSATSIWSVIYMGVAASGVGYYLYNLSIKEIGPTRTSGVVYSLVPIFVSVLALVFFDERITLIMVLSVVFVLLGLHLMMNSK